MWWDHSAWFSVGGIVMGLLMIAFWALVIWLVVALFRDRRPEAPGVRPTDPTPDPKEILRQRFARGEIDEQEFRAKLEVLTTTRQMIDR